MFLWVCVPQGLASVPAEHLCLGPPSGQGPSSDDPWAHSLFSLVEALDEGAADR